MAPPVVSFVGKSESGKTTFLERLIVELKMRSLRVGVIKHAGEIDLDTERKDSWRFRRAGSDVVAVSSPREVAIIKKTERSLSLDQVLSMIPGDYELILTEGFKHADAPKIEVHRREQGPELLSPESLLLAVITDEPMPVKAPQFSHDDVSGVARFLEKYLAEIAKEKVQVMVNDAVFPVSPRVQDLISRTLLAISLSLGAREIQKINVSLRRNP